MGCTLANRDGVPLVTDFVLDRLASKAAQAASRTTPGVCTYLSNLRMGFAERIWD
jgi:hypothetical protein